MLSSRRCMATPNGRHHRWISSISILPVQIHFKAQRVEQRTELHANQVVVDRGPLAEGTICAKLII